MTKFTLKQIMLLLPLIGVLFSTTAFAQWQPVGANNGEVHSSGDWSDIAVDGNGILYVAFQDIANGKYGVGVKKYDGSTWDTLGKSQISDASGGAYLSMKVDQNNIPHVLFWDGFQGSYKLTLLKYEKDEWSPVGTSRFTMGNSPMGSLGFDNNNVPYVAFSNYAAGGNGFGVVMRFNGTTWEKVGSDFSAASVSYTSLVFDKSNQVYVGFTEAAVARVKKFDGTNWVSVGTTNISTGAARSASLKINPVDNSLYLGYIDQDVNNKVSVQKFDGNAWNYVGTAGFSDSSMGSGVYANLDLILDGNNQPVIAYSNADSSLKVSVMKYNGTAWEKVGNIFNNLASKSVSLVLDKKRGKLYTNFTFANPVFSGPWPIHTYEYQLCNPFEDSIQEFACNQYIYNDSTYVEDFLLTLNLSKTEGCDSVIYKNINIIHIEQPRITIQEFVMGVNNTYASYQWLLDGEAIAGATKSTYDVTQNGSYQVIVWNEHDCTDTSDIYKVNNASITNHLAGTIQIFPNPTQDVINIKAPEYTDAIISTLDGRIVLKQENAKQIRVGHLSDGVYFIQLKDQEGRIIKTEKITKQ